MASNIKQVIKVIVKHLRSMHFLSLCHSVLSFRICSTTRVEGSWIFLPHPVLVISAQKSSLCCQWRTEHKCRPGRRRKMPPFQEKIFIQLAKISHDLFFFSHSPKNEKFNVTNCAASPLACAAPNFQLFCPFLLRIVPFFNVNVTIFT